MPNIQITLLLEGARKDSVLDLIKRQKEIEDIPYERFELQELTPTSFELQINYPLSVFDHSVTQFLAVLFGELSFMRDFGKLTVADLDLPEEVYQWFGGPKFGARVVLERFAVKDPPLLIGIIKPSLGPLLTTDRLDEKIKSALQGGLHAVKDDEMQGDLSFASLKARIALAERHLRYIPALNVDSITAFASILEKRNIPMVLVNATALGFPLVHTIRNISSIPLMSHLSLQGVYHGTFKPRVFALLHRLFGCDAMITPIGDVGYYRISKEEEREMVDALTKELPIKQTMPILCGGARVQNLEEICRAYEQQGIAYGMVFGTQIFGPGKDPIKMARAVIEKMLEIKSKKPR